MKRNKIIFLIIDTVISVAVSCFLFRFSHLTYLAYGTTEIFKFGFVSGIVFIVAFGVIGDFICRIIDTVKQLKNDDCGQKPLIK